MYNLKISIVIPTLNEEGNIKQLVKRIDFAMNKTGIIYELIFIDDHSQDKTQDEIIALRNSYPIKFAIKKGKGGKAYSLLEGFKHAQYPLIAMIDADLQYPPEAIPHMVNKIAIGQSDIVVANRSEKKIKWYRKFLSVGFRKVFANWLHQLDCDVQSGLKVFKKEIVERVHINPSPWTFDLDFLLQAKNAGYRIDGVEIEFSERNAGQAKLGILKSTWEIGSRAIKSKFRTIKPIPFHPDYELQKGKGFHYKGREFIHHTDLPHSETAFYQINKKQVGVLIAIFSIFLMGLIINWQFTITILIAGITIIYFVSMLFGLYAVYRGFVTNPEIDVSESELQSVPESEWPSYTVFCPLYKEWQVIPQFVTSMSKLDYPKDKLQVLLLLEEDDRTTLNKVKQFNLPDYFQVVVVPHSLPKTKPKACNYGLKIATGEYSVIYDAEDVPDVQQLKKAVIAFRKAELNTVCIQAKLSYYNPDQNLLTRLFSAEYSLWFELILPGLQAINAPIPLGGTSNHFRTADLKKLQGWDAFNVTEDSDLGLRLTKRGYRTALVNSSTWEEANSQLLNWYRQRTRWIKGYIQTYLVHMRKPRELMASWKQPHLITWHLFMVGILTMFINPLMWVTTIAYFMFRPTLGLIIESFYPAPILYLAVFSAIVGNFLYIYYYMIACVKRGHYQLVKYIFLIPFYWLGISIAAWRSAYEVIVNPHYWAKTLHGLHLPMQDEEPEALTANQELVNNRHLPMAPAYELAPNHPRRIRYHLSQTENSIFHWDKKIITFINKTFAIIQHNFNLLKTDLKTSLTTGGMLITASMIANLFNFLYNAYLGRVISVEQFGTLSLTTSFIYLFQIPLGALSSTVNFRSAYWLGKYQQPAKDFWKYIRSHSIKISIAIMGLWVLATPSMAHFFNIDNWLAFYLFTPVWIIGAAAAVDRGFLSGSWQFNTLAVMVTVEAISKFLLAIIFVKTGLNQWVYAAIPLSLGISLGMGWWAAKRLPTKSIQKAINEVNYFSAKFFGTSLLTKLSTVVFLSLDVVLAKHYLSPQAAGEYALLSLVGKMVWFVGSLFSQFMMPVISRKEGANQDSQTIFHKFLGVSVLASLSAYVIVGSFGYLTVPVLLGTRAEAIVPWLPLYTMGIVCFVVASNIINYHQACRHYLFSIIGLVLTSIPILGMVFFHNTVEVFALVMVISGLIYLETILLVHSYYSQIVKLLNSLKQNLNNSLNFKIKFIYPNSQPSFDKTRILIFNWRDTKHVWAGGAEVYIQELAKRWVTAGHPVTLFCGNDGHQLNEETIDGIKIIRRGGFYTVYLWAALYYIFRFRGRYDLVIDCENGIPFFTPLYARAPVITLVHHIHQEVFLKFLQLKWHLLPLAVIAKFLESQVMPMVYRNTQIVTVSQSSKQAITKLKLGNQQPIKIINPGVDLINLYPRPKTPHPSILYLGRTQAYKSIDIVIRAMQNIRVQLPKIKFTIAGDGESREELENLVKELNLEKVVTFLGKVSDSVKVQLLAQSWVMVQPSSFEGWGITTIEANACGTPVIASDVPGLRDSVRNPHTGILVPWGDVNGFVEKITLLIKDEKLRKKLEKGSLEWAQEFSWDKSAESWLKIIRDTLMNIDDKRQESKKIWWNKLPTSIKFSTLKSS